MTFKFDGTGNFPTVRQAETKLYYRNNKTVVSATLEADETLATENDLISYELGIVVFDANDNETSTTWEIVTKSVAHVFSSVGEGIKLRVILAGTGGANTYVENIRIKIVEV